MNPIYLRAMNCVILYLSLAFVAVSIFAADRIEGRVEGGGQSIARANVSLWLTGSDAPQKLAETKTNNDGRFDLTIGSENDPGGVLYLIARGGEAKAGTGKGSNSAITLMATLGTTPPQRVTINELTTVASAWTA